METNYAEIAEKVKEAAEIAAMTPNEPENKLRELAAPLWEEYIRSSRLNLNFQLRDELTLANGRPDTVFNRLILEYKKPGVIKPNNDKNRQIISQVKGYIEDFAKAEYWKQERLLGIVFDGHYFLFVRKVKRWITEEPIPVSAKSVERFLTTLEKLTSKAALIPDNLIRDFAVGTSACNTVAAEAIKAFYRTLKDSINERVQVFFDQWVTQFAEVHGAFEKKRFDPKTFFQSYGFTKKEQKDFDVPKFFFALDTYYGVLMKLLAYQVVGYYALKDLVGLPLTDWEKVDSYTLKEKMETLEDGGIFWSDPFKIRNFLEGDLLSWYLNAWNPSLEQAIRHIIARLNQYDPETMELVPDETRDILKKLYQSLVPKKLRHDLGEYYTPDWLAERCLNQIGYGVNDPKLLEKRILDPSCGSGTFLILAVKRAKEHAAKYSIDPGETLKKITRRIVGFDLNPLAVISARTNYLLAVADLLRYKKEEVTIPVYLCDSIKPPKAREPSDLFDKEAKNYGVLTSVGTFQFPDVVVKEAGSIQTLTGLLEDNVKKQRSAKEFLGRVHRDLQIELSRTEKTRVDKVLAETYEKLLDLGRKGINSIWARIIKNAFAPLFVRNFDYIVGNPPWVNWESLPQDYRDQTMELWHDYGLFSLRGHAARLGGGKKDISMLMMYVAIDKYLKENGKLCFVITQTLFKTQGAGDGFRRFQLGNNGRAFKVEQLDDMVELQPFEGATNRTAVVLCTKGKHTEYPIPYTLWKKKQKGSIALDFSFQEVSEATIRRNFKAQPIGVSETSPWLSAYPKALDAIQNVVGQAAYKASAGSTTWLNGVFWGDIEPASDGFVIFKNLYNVGKNKAEPVEQVIETTLVYPLLRGREIRRWFTSQTSYLIVSQNPEKKVGYEIEWMREKAPKTLAYFEQFYDLLIGRSGYKKYLQKTPYYSIYNVSKLTFSPFKVVWSEVGHDIEAAVISSHKSKALGNKIVVPDHTGIMIPFEEQEEAHYVCAVLNSSLSQFIVRGYVVLHPSPHILKNIKIPKYDKTNYIHQDLIRLSQQCHEKVTAGIEVSALEEQIDELATELWGLDSEELKEIKRSLEAIR